MLPGMSGYDVVRTLRTEGIWVPVLMLSAKDGEYDQADGLDYGADDYLTKPFSFVVLLARLRALLRRRRPSARPSSAAGEVSLDPATHQVQVSRRAGRPDPARVHRCWSTSCAAPAGWSARPSCWTTCGTRPTTPTPTRWRSTSATCAASWAGTCCRPYGASDTGWLVSRAPAPVAASGPPDEPAGAADAARG